VVARRVELRELAGEGCDQPIGERGGAERQQDQQKRKEAELPDASTLPGFRTSAERPQNREIVTLESAPP